MKYKSVQLPGFEGQEVRVSKSGQVQKKFSYGKPGAATWRNISGIVDQNGRRGIRLKSSKDGKNKLIQVGRLVLSAWGDGNKPDMFVWHIDGDASNDSYDNLRWYNNKNDLLRALELEQNKEPEQKTKVKPKTKVELLDSRGVPWIAEHYIKNERRCVAVYRHRDKVPYLTHEFERANGKIESGDLIFKETITPKALCKRVLETWLIE